MANLSNATRRTQILHYLQSHADQWVDGPELASAEVGGSEGLRRLRELRAEGHRIITRPHPSHERDIFQYKLIKPESIAPVIQHRLDELAAQTVVEHSPGPTEPVEVPQPLTPAGRPFLLRRNENTGEFELTKEVCVECGGVYDDDLEHRTTDARHLRWLEAEQKRSTGQLTVGVPEQPPPYKFTNMPDKIDMGTMMWCPRCLGKRRKRTERFSKKKMEVIVTEAEDFTRDPYRPTVKGEPNLCPRCGGLGVVPVHVQEGDHVAPIRLDKET